MNRAKLKERNDCFPPKHFSFDLNNSFKIEQKFPELI